MSSSTIAAVVYRLFFVPVVLSRNAAEKSIHLGFVRNCLYVCVCEALWFVNQS